MTRFVTLLASAGRGAFSLGWWSLLALLLLVAPLARAQAPAWEMALAVPHASSGYSQVDAVAAAPNGDVYLAGTFNTSVSFGSTTLYNYSGVGADIFVAKWSRTTGQFAWVQQAGGIATDGVAALAVSGTNLYLTGSTGSPTARFGPHVLASNPGAWSGCYLAKLVDAGNSGSFSWAQQMNGQLTALAVADTTLYAAGEFSGTKQFGNAMLTSNSFSSDVLVLKLLESGSGAAVVWAQQAGGTSEEACTALAVAGSSVYVAGAFYSSSAPFGSTTLTSRGGSDAYVAKLTDAGTSSSFAWAQQVGSQSNDWALALAVQDSSVYVAGSFEGSVAQAGSIALPNAGGWPNQDAYVAKLTDAGSFVWAQRAGGTADERPQALLLDGSTIYLVGYFNSSASAFGITTLTNTNSRYTDDLFVARLMDSGPISQFTWAQYAGGVGNDRATAACLSGGAVYVGGYVEGNAQFSALPVAGPASMHAACLASFTPRVLATATALLLPGSLYPNPARTMATVQLPPVPGAATATLALLDALGRVVRTTAVALPPDGLRHELDLRGVPAGLYAVRVAAGGRTATQRLVVE